MCAGSCVVITRPAAFVTACAGVIAGDACNAVAVVSIIYVMPRKARNQSLLDPSHGPKLYHVGNRGVDRREIFRSQLDYVVFLSILSLACVEDGLVVHTFCLMPNHFHLLIEDPKGMIDRMMLRLQSAYARYFNDSRGARGTGHVFGQRYFLEPVESIGYYDRLVSYILLNPLNCERPLAGTPEGYAWSSASLHTCWQSEAEYCASILDRFGGADAIMASMPKLSRREYVETRRRRLEALQGGRWLTRSAPLLGRTADEFRAVVMSRRKDAEPQDDAATGRQIETSTMNRASKSHAAAPSEVPSVTARMRPEFRGNWEWRNLQLTRINSRPMATGGYAYVRVEEYHLR
jgi:REP element-mobilizing transposase RayT